MSLLDPATRERIAALQQHFLSSGDSDTGTAWHDAVVQIGRTIRDQSYLLAYSDAFYLMGVALLLVAMEMLRWWWVVLPSLALRPSWIDLAVLVGLGGTAIGLVGTTRRRLQNG